MNLVSFVRLHLILCSRLCTKVASIVAHATLACGQTDMNEKFELSFKPFKLKWEKLRRHPLIPIGITSRKCADQIVR